MKKILIVGNSHAATLSGIYWGYENNQRGFANLDNSIHTIWDINTSAHSISIEMLNDAIPKNFLIDQNTIVLGYFGSYDVRENLVNHNNSDECVDHYCKTFIDFFSKFDCSIGFIDPVPPADDTYFFERDSNYDKWGNGSREELLDQYVKFTNRLDIYSKIRIKISNNIISGNFIKREDSYDGCHLNRSRVESLLKDINENCK